MNEKFRTDLAHTFGIALEEQTDVLSFHDNDGHEWILECASQSEILFFYCYLLNSESIQINSILEMNSDRELLGMFFLSLKDDNILLNIAFPADKIDITEFANLMENGYLLKNEIIRSLSSRPTDFLP
ncbi:type III secretion system LEE chaperone CesF [Escherichia coli]|nr:type III secretion system LEE chaperone CesF [Escherichia coli]EGN9260422.1 type III secretion system LEE chaperone CesF [Escherichia coli]EKZ9124178.1 type III secretion system LEE chaperone CesF [Escherichia coli]